MSLVSMMPYGRTLEYWWAKLEGHPERGRFMALKLMEVTAFLPNAWHNARRASCGVATKPSRAQDDLPWPLGGRVAVVVPVYARTQSDADMVQRLLARLREQTLRPSTIIVVDDGSPVSLGSTPEVVRLGSNGGPANARNQGIRRALASQPAAIALTDMDCLPSHDWIAAIAAGFSRNPKAHILSGRTDAYDRSWLGRYHEVNGTLNGRRRKDGLLYGPTCNLAIRTEVCREIEFDPGFPTAASEDIDFCLRARLGGWSARYCPEMRVDHDFGYDQLSTPRGLWRMWRQFRRYASGERRLLRAHPDYGRWFEGSTEVAEASGSIRLRSASGTVAGAELRR